MAQVNIREIALDTLMEILEHGQFSHIILKQVLDKYAYLSKQERAFINRLVSGVVERTIELDYVINDQSKTKVKKMKPLIRTALRMGAFEIYYMDAVPDSATCNEYVKLSKKRGFSGLSGFVNGVLRSVARQKGQLIYPDESTRYSIPQWIIDRWTEDYGANSAAEICQGLAEPDAGLCIRVNLNRISRQELADRLTNQGFIVELPEELPTAIFISNVDTIATIPEFTQGLFYIQDYSSQLVAQLAGIEDGDRVLDVCAAPGGKALHAAELAGSGSVLARDLTEGKIALINENIKRAGATNIRAQQWDATVLDAASVEQYDVVLADLPCSGLGIIRKKPDIKYNQTPESLVELAQLQAKMLDIVCQYVKPGGRLVYSTCTVNRAENAGQVQAFVNRTPGYEVTIERQLFPTESHDGFYICAMERKAR